MIITISIRYSYSTILYIYSQLSASTRSMGCLMQRMGRRIHTFSRCLVSVTHDSHLEVRPGDQVGEAKINLTPIRCELYIIIEDHEYVAYIERATFFDRPKHPIVPLEPNLPAPLRGVRGGGCGST